MSPRYSSWHAPGLGTTKQLFIGLDLLVVENVGDIDALQCLYFDEITLPFEVTDIGLERERVFGANGV